MISRISRNSVFVSALFMTAALASCTNTDTGRDGTAQQSGISGEVGEVDCTGKSEEQCRDTAAKNNIENRALEDERERQDEPRQISPEEK